MEEPNLPTRRCQHIEPAYRDSREPIRRELGGEPREESEEPRRSGSSGQARAGDSRQAQAGDSRQARAGLPGLPEHVGEPAHSDADRAIYDWLAGIPNDDPGTDVRMYDEPGSANNDVAMDFLVALPYDGQDQIINLILEKLGITRHRLWRDKRQTVQRMFSKI